MLESLYGNLSSNNIRVALMCALMAHAVLLLVVPGVGQLPSEVKQGITFTLMPLNPATLRTEPMLKTGPVEQLELAKPARQESQDAQQKTEIVHHQSLAPVISQQAISQWADSQVPQLGYMPNPELDMFKKTFAEPEVEKVEAQQSFTNVFGEQHVVTRLNGKDVCFMQSVPIVDDDWSSDIVMFYDCAKPEKFDLGKR